MNTTEDNVVKVGSRKSQLALIQTRYVISLLEQLYPDKVFEIVRMSTLGDRVLDVSLPKIGEKSLFTRDLEDALRSGAVHLVVHSLKDLPTALPPNMAIGAVLEREDPRDALVLRPDFKGHSLATLPPGSIIGTSSLRRTAQISRSHPHLRVVDIRGNLNTRLHKLDHHYKQQNIETSDNCNSTDSNPDSSNSSSGNGTNGDSSNGIQATKSGLEIPNYVGLILAQAGLVRMGWEQRISQVLPSEEVLYAVGQGALAIECMADNGPVLRMLAALNHPETYCRVLAERSFLKTLGGGCSAPVAVATTYQDGHNYSESSQKLEITGAVWSLNGETKIEESLEESLDLSSPLIKPSGCPYEVKSKVAKHKLTENECAVKELEASEAKRFKSTYEGSCTRNVEEIESKKVGCCRMKAMSSAMSHAEPVDIENLINIHGKLFKYCPFSETGERVCPVEYPSINMSGECHGEDLSDALVKMHPRRLSYDIKKCPFMSNQVVAINSQMDSNSLKDTTEAIPKYNLGSEPNAKNCPFLKLEGVNVGSKLEADASWSSAAKLYCGLIRHAEIGEEALERCEELGRRLADKLIGRGALEVMHCAQNFIRSSLPDNFTLAK